jgi:hypothetical protein
MTVTLGMIDGTGWFLAILAALGIIILIKWGIGIFL